MDEGSARPLPNRREYPWEEGWAAPWAFGDIGSNASVRLGTRIQFTAERGEADKGCPLPCCDGWQMGRPEPVDSRPENASSYGLLHMIGNVYEWVETAPTGDAYEASPIEVMGQPGFGSVDSYDSTGYYAGRISGGTPSVTRDTSVPRERQVGFRCAYDPPE
jgi:hypothetical protein